MTNEETIKRIQELVPSVMELEFGCRIKHKKRGYGTLIDSTHLVFENEKESIYAPFIDGNCTILGKPITLAVIFQAIFQSLLKQNDSDSEEKGLKLDSDIISLVRGHFGYKGWDLSKDNFNDQSEETKSFIGGLLGN